MSGGRRRWTNDDCRCEEDVCSEFHSGESTGVRVDCRQLGCYRLPSTGHRLTVSYPAPDPAFTYKDLWNHHNTPRDRFSFCRRASILPQSTFVTRRQNSISGFEKFNRKAEEKDTFHSYFPLEVSLRIVRFPIAYAAFYLFFVRWYRVQLRSTGLLLISDEPMGLSA